MIVLIDNYDSFVHNLARYLRRLGQETHVVRNDETTPEKIASWKPQAIVISPGPCTPREAGCSTETVSQLSATTPILGVCLGHQAIAAAFGGRIVRAAPMHGRSSLVRHDGQGIFAGLPNPLRAGRYHSLIVDRASISREFCVTAETEDDIVMSISHRALPVFGVQFHPEAILTVGGYRLLSNFLRIAGVDVMGDVDALELAEYRPAALPDRPLPTGPITF